MQVETPTLTSISSILARVEADYASRKSVLGFLSRHDCWKLSKSRADVLHGVNRSLLSAAEQAEGP